MNFQQLEYALAVHQLKHFGKAAKRCNITQATLSAMIKKLEEELKITLFNRSRHPIQTTEEGIEVLKKVKVILTQQQELLQLSNSCKNSLEGELRLGVIPTISNTLLPLILPKIVKHHSELKLIISEITTTEIIRQLTNGQIDIGLLSTPLEELDNRFEEKILYYEAMMVYGELSTDKAYVSSEDVENRKVWLLEEGHCFRKQTITLCKVQRNKEKTGNIEFKSNSFETLLNLTDQFGGLTLIPELYTHNLSTEKKKKIKGFQSPIPVREISLIALEPVMKRNSMNRLSRLIQQIISPKLLANNYPNKDLKIVGI